MRDASNISPQKAVSDCDAVPVRDCDMVSDCDAVPIRDCDVVLDCDMVSHWDVVPARDCDVLFFASLCVIDWLFKSNWRLKYCTAIQNTNHVFIVIACHRIILFMKDE
jgi:hypothetical protein